MNPILLSAVLAWCMAQSAKVIYGLVRYGANDKSRIIWRIIWAGGMPSAHSAVVSSATLVIYYTAGAQNLLFGLAMLVSFIVIYDRSRMYAIYRQFQMKYPWLKSEVQNDAILKDLVGHRISEILAGVFIGLGSGFMALRL
jgi:uncharacterized protein